MAGLYSEQRHLKVEGRYNPGTNKVYVSIKGQTHRYESFGNCDPNYWGINAAFRMGTDLLVSHNNAEPQVYKYLANGETWFIVGPANVESPIAPVEMTLTEWERFKRLVTAYNVWGEEKVKKSKTP